MLTQKDVDDVSYRIIGAAIEVHKNVGPGFIESVYEKCFLKELELRGLSYRRQPILTYNYKGIDVNVRLRADLIVEDLVVVELKAVDILLPLFEAKLLTYMRLAKCPKGIILNFSCTNIFREGQKTFVNELYSALP